MGSLEERARESWESRLWRMGGNIFPAYRRTGARIVYVSSDFHEVLIKIPSNWRTRNHMGMTWGGGLYSALDPIYGVMLYKLLGYKYRVVDKRADLHFKKPATETLYAKFCLTRNEINDIHEEMKFSSKIERAYQVSLVDIQGIKHVDCFKTLSILASKQAH